MKVRSGVPVVTCAPGVTFEAEILVMQAILHLAAATDIIKSLSGMQQLLFTVIEMSKFHDCAIAWSTVWPGYVGYY